MAYLQVLIPGQEPASYPLTQTEPITIGKHTSCTIVIDDGSLPMLLARVLWNRKAQAFEMTAAAEPDLPVSGNRVRTALLRPGDRLKLSDCEILYLDGDQAPRAEDVTLDFSHPTNDPADPFAFPEALPGTAKRPVPPNAPGISQPEPAETASPHESPSNRKSEKSPPDFDSDKKAARKERKQRSKTDQETRSPAESPAIAAVRLAQPAAGENPETVGQWLSRRQRPGEKDALRSPLVTALTVVSLLLVLGMGAFALLISRQSAAADFAAAQADRNAGKYAQALQRYEKFLQDYPRSEQADLARIELGFTRIERALSGRGADLAQAVQAIQAFVETHRQRADFRNWFPDLARYAQRTAIAAYHQASRQHDPQFLEVGDQARALFARFKTTTGTDDEPTRTLDRAERTARADLIEFDVRKQTLAAMDAHLGNKEVSELLATYRQAQIRYPRFADQPEFTSRIEQALQLEQAGIVAQFIEPEDQPRATREPEETFEPLWLLQRQQTRFDVQSDGQNVWVLEDGFLLACDRMTGAPSWQWELGGVAPFEPLAIQAKVPAWLIPVHNGKRLALVNRETGEALWQTELPARCQLTPTVTEGELFIVTEDQAVCAIELETGHITARMNFPRPLSAPAFVLPNHQLLLTGQQDLLYLIDRSRWVCQSIRYTGHASGTITAPPISIDERLLFMESDRLRSGKLSIYTFPADTWRVQTDHTERLPGIAVRAPILWGNRLFLETFGPRIAVWELSPDVDHLIKRLTVAPVPFRPETQLYLEPIDGDRLFVAGETLREFTLLTNTFEQKELLGELGRASQSLQAVGSQLWLASQQTAQSGTSLLHYDHDLPESFWRLQLGCDPLALLATAAEQPLRCIDHLGMIYELSRTQQGRNFRWSEPSVGAFSEQGTAKSTSATPGTEAGIRARTLEEPPGVLLQQGKRVRILDQAGKTQQQLTLTGTPQIAPARLPEHLLWGDAQGVHLTPLQSSGQQVQSWRFPVGSGTEATTQTTVSTVTNKSTVRWLDLQLINEAGDAGFVGLLIDAQQRYRVMTFRLREQPQWYLAETGAVELTAAAAGPGVRHEQFYTVALLDGRLLTFDMRTLAIREQTGLTDPPTSGPWKMDSLLLVEVAGHALCAFLADDPSELRWTLPLQHAPLARRPVLISPNLILGSQRDGVLWTADLKLGRIQQTVRLPAPLSCDPLIQGNQLICGLTNGSIIKIPLARLGIE